jgi:hypothetical protein
MPIGIPLENTKGRSTGEPRPYRSGTPLVLSRDYPNFLELRQREVQLRRTNLLGTSVHKPEVRVLTNLAHSPGHLLASTENFEDHSA